MTESRLPDRQRFYRILEWRVKNQRRILKIIKMMEPFFVRAETGEYRLYERKRLHKKRIASVIKASMRYKVCHIEFCSMARPVRRQSWMTHAAHNTARGQYVKVSLG